MLNKTSYITVIPLYVKIAECSIPRFSLARTTKSEDGTVDKMTLTQAVVS